MEGLVDIGRQRKLLILCLFIGNVAADCKKPTNRVDIEITEESLKIKKFPDGIVIKYKCILGYNKVSGTGKMTCVNGKWTKPDITCRPMDCGPPEPQPHMILDTRQGTLLGASVFMSCEKGYKLSGWSIKRCTHTGWFGDGRCVYVTCSIPSIGNGAHTWTSHRKPEYRQSINFTCNPGYNLHGSKTITCNRRGKYDPEPPKCIAVTCLTPDEVENGRHSWNNVRKPEYRQTIRFTCNTGYNLVGNETIRCTETGVYNSQPPRCVIVTCPKPTRVENGRHSWNNDLEPEYRQTIRFTCNTGYNLVGNETIRCTETGGYDSQPPRCVIVTCPKPTRVENGRHSWNNVRKPEYRQTIRFTCNTGYNLVGNEIIECTETGGYDSQPPRCVIVTCPKPTRVENGRHSWNNVRKPEYQETVYFTCNTGYNLVGNKTIRCTETGGYDSQPPRCVIVTCPKPTRVENGRHSWNNVRKPEYRETVHFTCNTGYTLFGNEIIRCTETGGYDSQPPRCVPDCSKPQHIENTVLSAESLRKSIFPSGTVIKYQCIIGYDQISGTGIIRCVNGKWTKPDIICKRKDCGFPAAQPHMVFDTSQGTLFGAVVTVTCKEGYRLIGSSFKHCRLSGWHGTAICEAVTCSQPIQVENGKHSWNSVREPEYQQTIRFTCNAGYTLFGNETIRCTKTAQFDSEPPRCIADCPKPQHVQNTVLSAESLLKRLFPSGTVIKYQCIIGYNKISGTGIIRCVNGKWTKPDIICKLVTCPKPTRVENGRHSWNNDLEPEYRQIIRFTCNTGYNLVGNETIRCTETGEYDSQPPRCVLVTCPKPTRVENGRHSWNNDLEPEYRQIIRFTCNTGYNLVGNETIRCTETGEYDSQPPRCVLVTCPKPTRVENGRHSWNNVRKPEYRQTIRFTCNTGYNLVGNETVRCTETGGYDSQPPRCVADCPKPQHVQNTVLSAETLRKRIFPSGTVIKYECMKGCDQIGGTGITRCVNGKWTKPDINCKRIDCGVPETKPHMSFETEEGTIIGAMATVICEDGYRVSGASFKQCMDEGWFGIADCISLTCSKPIKVENGKHSWNSDREPKYEQTIHFTCDAGYTLFGNETITCTESAEYDSEPPRCVRNCPTPKSVENMVLTNESLLREDFPDGTKVTYECANGFEKESGSEIITCIDGTWTEPDLICKKIEPPLNLLLIGVAVGCSLALLFCIFWVWRRCSDDSEG
ncbi:sushi, von Willebrand factor type A, EGF and pentraxin domain-containing protein 1-like isoform X6 [Poeciliopsis prolifica]|uniref:sushi, von Willebrand factor type A, EGF and pentraxin domain-containing protein 1-like isoform X6 n=1 Tax=Poeciliopsis prolifica TaxID=188132 RepID=UPI002413829D|nr:sushi, von Willebrand factor type A, EGF and pentraxin domain-containing protein 1-like isoform X6 [Poeciliopsis prolifica]